MRFRIGVIIAVFSGILGSPVFPTGTVSAQQPSPDETLISAAREIMEASRYAALVTLTESGTPRARMMDPFPPDSQFVVWMGTNRASRKVEDLQRNPRVLVYYDDPSGAGYVSIEGTARLVDDPAEKDRRWKEEWSPFYPDRDATYLLIAITPARMEVLNYRLGIMGDSITWGVPAVEFK
jgi:general stress protein 26